MIDKTRLSENIRTLKTHLPAGMGYRIVAKSLPSIDLISFIRDLSGTDRLMTFNQPMLSKLSVDMPEASQLLGKPLPVRAAQHYFETLPAASAPAADNVEWLIDTPARLQQYTSLASNIERPLKLVLELDVGLHRGGFTPGPELGAAIEAIEAAPNLTESGGLACPVILTNHPANNLLATSSFIKEGQLLSCTCACRNISQRLQFTFAVQISCDWL